MFVNCPVAKHFGICVKEIQRKIMIFCLISISINIYRFSLQPVSLIKSAKMITLVLKFHTLKCLTKHKILPFLNKKRKLPMITTSNITCYGYNILIDISIVSILKRYKTKSLSWYLSKNIPKNSRKENKGSLLNDQSKFPLKKIVC